MKYMTSMGIEREKMLEIELLAAETFHDDTLYSFLSLNIDHQFTHGFFYLFPSSSSMLTAIKDRLMKVSSLMFVALARDIRPHRLKNLSIDALEQLMF